MAGNQDEFIIWDQGNPSDLEFSQWKMNRRHFAGLRDARSEWTLAGRREAGESRGGRVR